MSGSEAEIPSKAVRKPAQDVDEEEVAEGDDEDEEEYNASAPVANGPLLT